MKVPEGTILLLVEDDRDDAFFFCRALHTTEALEVAVAAMAERVREALPPQRG